MSFVALLFTELRRRELALQRARAAVQHKIMQVHWEWWAGSQRALSNLLAHLLSCLLQRPQEHRTHVGVPLVN